MQLPVKCSIFSGLLIVKTILVGWLFFPMIFEYALKKSITLGPDSEIRKMWEEIPFPINFEIYIFNVTNARDVLNGDSPMLDEIGPYVYEEWRVKENLFDNETEDTVEFNQKMTWYFNEKRSGKLTGDEIVTIPHPMIMSMLLKTYKERPSILPLVIKAMNAIFNNPESIFLTVKVKDLLFDGIYIDCNQTDFFGKMACEQMKLQKNLQPVGEDGLLFSFFGFKNNSLDDRLKVKRGMNNSKDLNRVIEYKNRSRLNVWSNDGNCNTIRGTESTVFPPFIDDGEDLAAFAPVLCKSMDIKYVEKTTLFNIPVSYYNATLGDMSKNVDEKCYCPSNDTCLLKGAVDLSKCSGAPIIVTFPHFYDADASYFNAVRGLDPDPKKHSIEFYFEPISGSVLSARSCMQFNFELVKMTNVSLTENLPELLLPVLWISESVTLNSTYIHQINLKVVMTLKINNIFRWLSLVVATFVLLVSLYIASHSKRGFSLTTFHLKENNDYTVPSKNTMISSLSTIISNDTKKDQNI